MGKNKPPQIEKWAQKTPFTLEKRLLSFWTEAFAKSYRKTRASLTQTLEYSLGKPNHSMDLYRVRHPSRQREGLDRPFNWQEDLEPPASDES